MARDTSRDETRKPDAPQNDEWKGNRVQRGKDPSAPTELPRRQSVVGAREPGKSAVGEAKDAPRRKTQGSGDKADVGT